MEQQLLVKFSGNWADEFDVEGFIVLSETEWNEHVAKATRLFDRKEQAALPDPDGSEYSWRNRNARMVEVHFGTNEYMQYETLKDYLDSFEVGFLDQEQFLLLKGLFNHHYDEYSYEIDGVETTVHSRDVIYNGTVCMISDEQFEEEEQDGSN